MKKTLTTIAAGAFLLAAASVGYADNMSFSGSYKDGSKSANVHYSQQGKYPKKCCDRFLNKLNLTKDQRQKVQALQTKYGPQFDKFMQKLKSDRMALAGHFGKNYDEEKVSDLAEDYGETKADYIEVKMKFYNEVYKLLTPQQQQKMMQLKQNYMKKPYHKGH